MTQAYQRGGPTYTQDPNDPALQAYQDSLAVYNQNPYSKERFAQWGERFDKYLHEDKVTNMNLLGPAQSRPLADIFSELKIKPIAGFTVGTQHMPMAVRETMFKKPTQPVKYADPAVVAKQQILKDAGLYKGNLDGVWGPKSQAAMAEFESKQTAMATGAIEQSPEDTPKLPVDTTLKHRPVIIGYDENHNPVYGQQPYREAGGHVSSTGYRMDSPDKFRDMNIIPSGNISMSNVPHPVLGVDNKGNHQMMYPGGQYQFPGNNVTEFPVREGGGQWENPANMGILSNTENSNLSAMYLPYMGYGGGKPCLDCGGDIHMQAGGPFEPHMMYHPETGEPVQALTEQDHLRLGNMDYGHDPIYAAGGNWIQNAIKRPGRCTPGSPNYDCPKGSPQWHLAQTLRKMAKKNKKQYGGDADDIAPQNYSTDTFLENRINTFTGKTSENARQVMALEEADLISASMDNILQYGGDPFGYNPALANIGPYAQRYKELTSQRKQDLSGFFGASGNLAAAYSNPGTTQMKQTLDFATPEDKKAFKQQQKQSQMAGQDNFFQGMNYGYGGRYPDMQFGGGYQPYQAPGYGHHQGAQPFYNPAPGSMNLSPGYSIPTRTDIAPDTAPARTVQEEVDATLKGKTTAVATQAATTPPVVPGPARQGNYVEPEQPATQPTQQQAQPGQSQYVVTQPGYYGAQNRSGYPGLFPQNNLFRKYRGPVAFGPAIAYDPSGVHLKDVDVKYGLFGRRPRRIKMTFGYNPQTGQMEQRPVEEATPEATAATTPGATAQTGPTGDIVRDQSRREDMLADIEARKAEFAPAAGDPGQRHFLERPATIPMTGVGTEQPIPGPPGPVPFSQYTSPGDANVDYSQYVGPPEQGYGGKWNYGDGGNHNWIDPWGGRYMPQAYPGGFRPAVPGMLQGGGEHGWKDPWGTFFPMPYPGAPMMQYGGNGNQLPVTPENPYALPPGTDINVEYKRQRQGIGSDWADWGMAGMSFLSSLGERGETRELEDQMKQRMSGDAIFEPTGAGDASRGTYTANRGQFRPDQNTPVQFTGYNTGMIGSPQQVQGGGQIGDEQYLTQGQIDEIIAGGGQIEYID